MKINSRSCGLLLLGVLVFLETPARADNQMVYSYQQPTGQQQAPAAAPPAKPQKEDADDEWSTKDNDERLTITEENDKFASGDDRHYTQGMQVNWLFHNVTPNGFWDNSYTWLSHNLPIFQGGGDVHRKYQWTVVGQSIFTPTNLLANAPSRKDRPYGAWLYTGMSLLQQTKQQTHDTFENLELDGGVVGPLALGALTQNDFHQFIGVQTALGWNNQIHTEPGFVLTYERKWRFAAPLFDGIGADAIPEVGATGGNIYTYAETGALFRFGKNLAVDYGPNHVRPALTGTSWFDPSRLRGPLGWYVYAGTQGRAVGHNIFLDGNTIASSASVDRKTLVADFMAGAALFWSDNVRLDFSAIQRTKEFYGQQGHPDRFGSINLAFGF